MNMRMSIKRFLAGLAVTSVVALTAFAGVPAPVSAQALQPAANVAVVDSLTTAEADGLRYMREEEKLAHDVYVALYQKWGLAIFKNISASEQTHTDSIKRLLDRYGVPDPAAGQPAGVFTDATLQGLYNQLVAQGSQSLADALRVGAAIEEIDLQDLEARVAQTDKADIRQVYNNLAQGSRNHLRSFVSTLKTQAGQAYQPQYLSQAAFQAIVSTTATRGGAGRRP